MVPPEAVVLGGAALWLGAAFVTGVPWGRVPSEFPFLFSVIGIIGSLIGVTGWVPEAIDVWLTLGAVALYAITPVVFTIWLLHRYDPEDRSPNNPRTMTD